MQYEGNFNGVDVYRFEPIKITFVGARGSGKTSLMTSMCHELEDKGVSDFSVTTDTSRVLQETYESMLEMIEDTKIYEFVQNSGIAGSTDCDKYTFEGRQIMEGRHFIFPFEFTDMPGGWYTDTGAAAAHDQEVSKTLLNSTASFLVVDAPALFTGGLIHEKGNKPKAVARWYRLNKDSLALQHHTVILVLSRCERFISDSTMRDKLFEKVRKEYGPIVRELNAAGVDVVCTWVQTLGGVQFYKYEKGDDNVKHAQFIKTGEYDPQNCAMPLILALHHGMDEIEKRLEDEMQGCWQQLAKIFEGFFGPTPTASAHTCAQKLLAILNDKVGSNEKASTFNIN